MPVVALFGITNSGLNLFVNLVVLFLVVVWIALIAWTFLDARRRIKDPVLVACATGASLFPYVGTIVYSILRPPEFLEDARERDLEIRASELRVRQLEEQSCPNCAYPIERSYLRCPNCRARVKDPCENCEKPIDPRWVVCPYCEMPQRRAPEPPRRVAREERPREERAPRPAQRSKRPASRAAASTRAQAAAKSRPRPTRSTRSSKSASPASTTQQRKSSSSRTKPSSDGGREGPSDGRERPATAS
jgi:double zinc ribbon protein